MKLLKGLLAGVMALSLSACASNDDTKKEEAKTEPMKVLAPLGATSLSLLGLYGDKNVSVDTVDGTSVISAEIAKEDGEYDAIIAPINLGAALLSKGKSQYRLDSVVTWGNLYVVGTDEKALTETGMFAAFGEKAVPQKVFMASLDVKSIKPEITYFASVNEVQQQLFSKKANVGLMAEPAATATIAKAKEKGITLKVLKDLQKEYQNKNNTKSAGYPQAALFVKKGSEDKVKKYIETATTFANETSKKDETAISKAVETATPEKLGIPNAQIAVKTWPRLNINYVKAATVKEDIATFLKQFNISINDDAYTK